MPAPWGWAGEAPLASTGNGLPASTSTWCPSPRYIGGHFAAQGTQGLLAGCILLGVQHRSICWASNLGCDWQRATCFNLHLVPIPQMGSCLATLNRAHAAAIFIAAPSRLAFSRVCGLEWQPAACFTSTWCPAPRCGVSLSANFHTLRDWGKHHALLR